MTRKLKSNVYKILKRNGINEQLQHATTYKNDQDYGYCFALKNGAQGIISLVNGVRISTK